MNKTWLEGEIYNTIMRNENEALKERLKNYENPEDLTLMFMYCDIKANDKIKELQERIDKAIECIENNTCWELRTSKVLEILRGE